MLERQGGEAFFGEPALEIDDFRRVDEQGRGMINVLAADRLMRSPKLYATFLLWLLAVAAGCCRLLWLLFVSA